MNDLVPIIRPLDAYTLPDFLRFFDHDAFADNPRWAFCYCQFLYVDHNLVDWTARSLDENRAAACDRVGAERMQGQLAYLDGKVVAWCSAAPRPMMHSFDDEPVDDAGSIGMIGCFVVAKPYRRRGLARANGGRHRVGADRLKQRTGQVVMASRLRKLSGSSTWAKAPAAIMN